MSFFISFTISFVITLGVYEFVMSRPRYVEKRQRKIIREAIESRRRFERLYREESERCSGR